jgi:hypothetical protein
VLVVRRSKTDSRLVTNRKSLATAAGANVAVADLSETAGEDLVSEFKKYGTAKTSLHNKLIALLDDLVVLSM